MIARNDTLYKLGNIALEKNRNKSDKESPKENDEENIEVIDEEIINIETIVKDKLKGFRRTNPTSSPQTENNGQTFSQAASSSASTHKPTIQEERRPPSAQEEISQTERGNQQNPNTTGSESSTENQNQAQGQNIKYCHWFNNGQCHFEERSGRKCIFEHIKAPKCNFDGQCNRKKCMFSHPYEKQNNNNFLGQRPYAAPFQNPLHSFMEQMMGTFLQGQNQGFNRWGHPGKRGNFQ